MTIPDRAWLSRLGAWALGVLGAAAVAGQIARAGRIGGADAPHLLGVELRLGQLIRDGDIGHAISAWWALLAPQPPFGALLGTVTTVLVGTWPLSAALCMGLTLLAIFDALQRLSLRLTEGRLGGLLAWLAVLGSPFTWCSVEQYSRDLSVAAAVIQAVSHVAARDALQRRSSALAFGAWMGLAFGSKYTAPIFLIGPCLVVGAALVWQTVRSADRGRAEWLGLGAAFLSFAATAGVWYATHLSAVRRYLFTSLDAGAMQGHASSLRDVDSLEARVYYVAALWEAMSAPGVALLLLALLLGFWRRESRFGMAVVGLGAAVGMVILARTSQQVDRYLFPSFVLASAAMVTLGRGWVLPLLVVVAMAPRAWTSAQRFAPGEVGAAPSYAHGVGVFRSAQWPQPANSFAPSDFQPAEWQLREAVAALRELQGPTGTVGYLPSTAPNSPSFGHLMLPAASLGCRWDWSTVSLRGGGKAGEVFVGPLFDGEWPPRGFTSLIALERNPAEGPVQDWLRSHSVVEVARVPTRGSGAFVVYRVEGMTDPPSPERNGGPK